jgi:TPR repeat protein
MMKLINKIVLAKLLTVFLLMGFLSFYAVPQVDAKSDDIDIETTIQKAKQGDASAQYDLASMYSKGKGVVQDYKQAFTWCKKAAEQGHVWAQYGLGLLYHEGQGVPQDYKQAVYWYKKAAEQGEADAQYNLASMYAKGEGVPQDYKQAFTWCKKAAEQGHASAQFNLGYMYDAGQGVPQDYKQAVYWWEKAAEQGLASAQNNLGYLYDKGEGVPQDYKQAVYWYKKAAEQGNASAQFSLGEMYFVGKGVPQNYIYAYAWWSLAVAQGFENAKGGRDVVANTLSSQQLIQAQELASKIQYKIDNPSKPQKSDPSIPETEINQVHSTGTGFIITRNGYILTCHHVIKDAKSIKIVMGETQYIAKLIRDDPHNDLALLKIDGSFSAIAFSSKRSAKMGQEVFTIGFPNPNFQGVSAKFTKGAINSLTGFQDDLRLYQISIPVQPGNSGGALLDDNGNILGVIVAQLDAKTTFKISGSLPQNVNYAIKSIYAQAMLDTLPGISDKLLSPSKKQSFENAVNRVKKSTVMVLSYKE